MQSYFAEGGWCEILFKPVDMIVAFDDGGLSHQGAEHGSVFDASTTDFVERAAQAGIRHSPRVLSVHDQLAYTIA